MNRYIAQEGLGIFFRDSSINPPPVRKILNSIGNEKVTSLELVRTPLHTTTTFLLNVASLGQLDEKLKKVGIDKLFHLSLWINKKYILEKNEVIKLTRGNPVKKNSETLEIPVKRDTTILDVIQKTQKKMGDKYGSYDAVKNNCSVFVDNVLIANDLQTQNGSTFLHQKVPELYEHFPSLTKFITDIATNLGAIADRQIQGEGNCPLICRAGF